MRHFIPVKLILTGLCCCLANADEIKFHDGRTMTGTVVEYKEGYVKVQKPDDECVRENIALIAEILFKPEEQTGTSDVTKPGVSPEIQRQISEKIAETKKELATSSQPKAMVALYLDTESPHDFIPQGYIEYRCYYDSGGFSGSYRVPLRQAWTRLEYTRLESGKRRIQLDPGPPYETINRDVLLTDGAVTNLGRIVLKRVKAEGTADIHGTVKDSYGHPLADVDVSAGSKQTRTDAEGKYVLDRFGLEVVSLKASKDGYFGGAAQVSIRNMDNREIEKDLILHRPRQVKLRYVIGGKKSDSLVGSDAEEGTIELTVDSIYFDLSKRHFSSKSFHTFATDTHLRLEPRPRGQLAFANAHAPIFYQAADPDIAFDSITEIGSVSLNSQRCPPLKEGSVILIRGFQQDTGWGISDYCVKILVEELTCPLTAEQAAEMVQRTKKKSLTLDWLTSIDKDVAKELAKFKGWLSLPDLRSIDRDVAQELGTFEGSRLNITGLASIDKDVARELVKHKKPLCIGLTSIDKAVAQELAKHEGWLSLPGLISINSEVARELASHKLPVLHLGGLASIDKDVAQELAGFRGESLCLYGLNSVDEDMLEILNSNAAIKLEQNDRITQMKPPGHKLTKIDKDTVRELVRHETNRLDLSGLISIDKDTAEELATFQGNEICLNGLSSIDDEVAKELAKFQGDLYSFGGLHTIDQILAKELAKFQVGLYLPGLTSIDKNVAKELINFQGGSLWLVGLTSIDRDSAQELAKIKGTRLSLSGLTSLTPDVAQKLVDFKAENLSLNGLPSIDKELAQELAKSKGGLSLNGLTSINKEVAQELAKSEASRLWLDGLNSIDKELAYELAQFKGGLILNGLTSIDKESARELVQKKGGLHLKGLTSIDDETLKILNSHPSITLPEKYQN